MISILQKIRGPKRVADKIFLLVLALEVFSLTLWGALSYLSAEQELSKSISARLNETAFRTQTEIGNFLLPIQLQIELSGEEIVANAYDLHDTKRLFHRLMRTRLELEEISLLQQNAKELLRLSRMNSYGADDLRQLNLTKLFKGAVSGKAITSKITFSEFFEPQVQLIVPVKRYGTVENFILTTINLKWLGDVVHAQTVGGTGYVYVVDDELTLIGHQDPSLVLSKLHLRDSSVPSHLFTVNRGGQYLLYNNFSGKKVAGVSRFDPVNNWWVVVELPVTEGLAPLRRIVSHFIWAFVVAVLITIVAVLLVTKRVMRPLEFFERSIRRIEQGERNVHMPVPENTDLSALATSFNAMAQSLDRQIYDLTQSELRVRQSEEQVKQLNSTLQQRVDDATRQLRETNIRLEKAYIQSEQANKAKNEFLTKMSHELRTPLNGIIGYGELLLDESQDPVVLRDVHKIISSGRHLLGLINNLLDLSKIEVGKMELFIECFSVDALLQQAIDNVGPLLAKKNNSLELVCDHEIGMMMSDATKLKQVFINLMGNACKFTENGNITVAISPLPKEKIKIEIRDTGIGMTPEQLGNLFQAFTQADPSIHNRYGGTGLGLVISRHFCNMLGGEISVQSQLGKGTSFFVTLPLYFSEEGLMEDAFEVTFAPECSELHSMQNVQ